MLAVRNYGLTDYEIAVSLNNDESLLFHNAWIMYLGLVQSVEMDSKNPSENTNIEMPNEEEFKVLELFQKTAIHFLAPN